MDSVMFTFMKAGSVVFSRSDAEQAEWTQEQMTLLATFPYKSDKVIERGMTVIFQDPATLDFQAYEIRNVSGFALEGYQQFTAEDLAISELKNRHIPEKIEITDQPINHAMTIVLSGTGWQCGNVPSGLPVSSCDIERGDAWQAVCDVRNHWNVYLTTRVTFNDQGIGTKYIDIINSNGTWRGLRLAVNKNMNDPIVTYDDTELYTALYAYGGTYSEGTGEQQQILETNITGVVWTATAEHPAKPAGLNYIEWPEKTALYGRNGTPRYGYYQNASVDDPDTLIELAWESLKQCADPKISINGTVEDLYRLGYADEPLRLYDMAIVELEPLGLLYYKQVTQLTVDLLNPARNTVNVGDYIPNIIYINRQTDDDATGGRRGRGGGTLLNIKQGEFQTYLDANERTITMWAREIDKQANIIRQAGMSIDPETGVIIYSESANTLGEKFATQRGMINVLDTQITAEVTRATDAETQLSGRLEVLADKVGMVVNSGSDQRPTLYYDTFADFPAQGDSAYRYYDISARKYYEWSGSPDNTYHEIQGGYGINAGEICTWINSSGEPEAMINASKIYLLGQTIADTITANYIATKVASIPTLSVRTLVLQNSAQIGGPVYASEYHIGTPDGSKNLAFGLLGGRVEYVGNDTYRIVGSDFNGNDVPFTGTFSRATTLSGAWSGNAYTVTASPQGDQISTQTFVSTPVWGEGSDKGKATVSFYYFNNGERVEILPATINCNPQLQDMTGSNKITANGTYVAGQGYIGYGAIEIDVPQGGAAANVAVQFGGPSGARYIEAIDSITGTQIQGATMNYQLGLNGTQVEIQMPATGSKMPLTDSYQIPLETKNVTANGTYTPSSGKVGLSSITVNVPSDIGNAKSRFNAASGQYFIESYDSRNGNSIANSSVTYKLGVSGATVQVQNASGSQLGSTPTLSLGINSGSVDNAGSRTLKVKAGGTDTTATVTITDYANGWAAARNSTGDFPTTQPSSLSASITVKRPNSTVNGTALSYSYSVSADNTYAYIKYGNTVVARTTHSAFTNGKNAVGLSINTNNATITRNQSSNSVTSVQIAQGLGSVNGSGQRTITVTANGTTLLTNVLSDYKNGYEAAHTPWITLDSSGSFGGDLEFNKWVKPYCDKTIGGGTKEYCTHTWHIPDAHIVILESAPASYISDLPLNSYIELIGVNNNGSQQHYGKIWHIPAGGSSHNTPFVMTCTDKQQTYPGSVEYNYTFSLQGSRTGFTKGSQYTFYR